MNRYWSEHAHNKKQHSNKKQNVNALLSVPRRCSFILLNNWMILLLRITQDIEITMANDSSLFYAEIAQRASQIESQRNWNCLSSFVFQISREVCPFYHHFMSLSMAVSPQFLICFGLLISNQLQWHWFQWIKSFKNWQVGHCIHFKHLTPSVTDPFIITAAQ